MHSNHAEGSSPQPRQDRAVVRYLLSAMLVTVSVCVIFDLIHHDYSSCYAFGFTAVGIWAFGVTALQFVHLCRPSNQHRKQVFAIALHVYVGSYVYFTSAGEYQLRQSGKIRYSFGHPVSDVSIWQPRFLHWQPFQDIYMQSTSRGSMLGYYYSPLIIIDRQWFHATRTLIEDEIMPEADAKSPSIQSEPRALRL
ncbi:MAG: hypothetical protein JNL58_05650 [Planctomyces sp.]|nr:hypothetical protein [Planctomyces sp.]